jgi:large subunit ribosomal protein L15
MMIHEITPKAGRYKKRKRIGRGPGSGRGKTAGRGHNGYNSRSGVRRHAEREGGQMPWFRRIPKRGFNNARFATVYAEVNIRQLDARFEEGAQIDPQALLGAGLIDDLKQPVKILGQGETKKKLTVTAAACSKGARRAIENAGGSVTLTK